MSIPKLAVSRPVGTLMLLLCVLVLGVISLFRLPLEFYPKLAIPFVAVVVPYPNSNPTQVEKTVARPLEEALATLPDIKKMRSHSSADDCTVILEFDWGLDLDVLRMLVREKVDQVRPQLPNGTLDVQIYSFNTDDIPIIQGRISAKGVDLSENYDLLETRIVNRIRRVPGVARVDLNGVEPREIFVDLRLDKIKAHRVDVGQLIGRLRSVNTSLSLGRITDDGRRYSARAVGAVSSLDEIGRIAVNQQGLRLSDVADLRYEEPPLDFGRHLDREMAIALDVFKESTANTVETAEAVQRVVREEIALDPLLQGINLFMWEDQAREIRSGIDGLTYSGLIGGALAILVLYFFLRRWDSTLIVSASIPISLLATTSVMYFTGRNLNVLAVMGLMLGVGMLVDNAIVVLESIDRRHRIDPDTKRSASVGAAEVAVAITASTLTSVIVFLPLVVGKADDVTIFLGEAGFTISVSLLSSLAVSLLMIPMLSAWLLQRRKAKEPPAITWLEERYARVLGFTFRHKGWTFLAVVGVLVVGFLPFFLKLVDASTFAGGMNRRLYLSYDFHDFSYKSDTERVVDQVESYLYAHKDEFLVKDVYSYFQDNNAGTTIVLSQEGLDDADVKALRKKIRDGLPEIPAAKVYFREEEDEGGETTYFSLKLFGNDLEGLSRWAETVALELQKIEDIQDVVAEDRDARLEVQARLDRERARRLGLLPQDMADVFGFTLGGIRLPRLARAGREVEINLGLARQDRENLEDLRQLVVGNAEGRPILLDEIADFQVVRRANTINRENRKIRTEVRAAFDGKEFGPTKEKITEMMSSLGLPPGITWSWNDRIQEQGEEGQQMALNFLLALLLVYILMASLFESLTQPFSILFAIPFSLVGATWLLVVTGTPFNLMANMGVLILMGIVVNNGIVLLDRVNYYRREGLGREEAVMAAGRDRLRPIVMTASTTVLGLLPLALGSTGVGGWVYYYPLARTVMGGLISSTFLTLIVLPYIDYGVESFSLWTRRLWAASRPPAATATTGSTDADAIPLRSGAE